MAERWRRLNIRSEAAAVVSENAEYMAEQNRKQLMNGLGSDGQPLMPISQDPHFKSKDSAKRYADWKHRLFPETPYDRPNLNITGFYHSRISVQVNGYSIIYASDASFAESVAAKYRDKQLGLNKDSRVLVWRQRIRPLTVVRIGNITGCTVR